MPDSLTSQLAAEEAKRNRHVPVEQRRRMNEAALKRLTGEALRQRNTKEACLANQARLLAGMKSAAVRHASGPQTE